MNWTLQIILRLESALPLKLSLKKSFLLLLIFCCSLSSWGQITAINLDGTNDYINSMVEELGTGNRVHTIEALIKIDALPPSRSRPLNFGQFNIGSHHWLLQSDGTFAVGAFARGQVQLAIPVEQWTHIAAVYDGTNLKVYVNGGLAGSTAVNFNFWNSDFHLGRPWASAGENYFDGSIDQVRIWNVARTAEQIEDYQYKNLPAGESGLVAYYNFSEGTANGNNTSLTTVVDGSGNGNTGTINNLARTGNSSNWVGSVFSLNCPLPGTPCDDNNPNTYSDTEDGSCNCAGVLNGANSVCVRITSGIDDVEQLPDGSMYAISSDLELMTDVSRGDQQAVGLRFKALPIPKGATINSATIMFSPDESDSETTTITIHGEDADNATAFGSINSHVTSRTKTTASVNWSIPSWPAGLSGVHSRSPDLASIVQEIVDRGGWVIRNDMVFILTGSGQRVAEAFEGNSSLAAQLCVTYDYCALVGTSCDDGNVNTSGDIYDENCACSGTCTVVAGTACDDGNESTYDDKYNASCECRGTPAEMLCRIGGTNNYFDIKKSICCFENTCCYRIGSNPCGGEYPCGEVHILIQDTTEIEARTYNEFCGDVESIPKVTRGTKKFRRTGTTQVRNNSMTTSRLLYEQSWQIEETGEGCGSTIFAGLTVFVYVTNDDENLVLGQNTILSDTFAANTIIASKTIPTLEEVVFLAGTSITLQPGFAVNQNASFTAKIASNVDCSDLASFTGEAIPTTQRMKVENKPVTTQPSLRVYPNPFSTFATIDYQLTKPTMVTLSLMNLTGQVIKKIESSTQKYTGKYSVTLDNTTLIKGIYLVKLQTDTEQLVQKVIVQ